MLEMFHLDIAKVDLDVAYICKCFKCFHTYDASVFHLDVAMFTIATHVFSSFSDVLQVFQTYVAGVSYEQK
jgi:hypothetical protein